MSVCLNELTYLAKRPMKQLTHWGGDDLYLHPLYGARSINDCIELDALRARLSKPSSVRHPEIEVSEELMLRHLRCVDTYDCGLL